MIVMALTLAAGAAPQDERAIPDPPWIILPGVTEPSEGPWTATSLAEILAALAVELNTDASLRPPAPPRAAIAPDVQFTALKRYVEGKAALTEGKALVAVQKLEMALAADPAAPAILAELALAYSRIGNQQKATAIYERLLEVDPGRPEALLALGLQASNRGESKQAIMALAPLFLLPHDTKRAAFQSFRAEAETAVELALARALRDLGADRAIVEVLTVANARPTTTIDNWQRAEARSMLGDAHARLGAIEEASAAWSGALRAMSDGAATAPIAAQPALVARAMWGHMANGRDDESLTALQDLVDGGESGSPTDEAIALAAWLEANLESREAIIAWSEALAPPPHDAAVARLVAALDPREATHRLASAVDPQRPDRKLLQALFASAARESPEQLIKIAAAELDACVSDPDSVIEALVRCGLDAPALVRASASNCTTSECVALRIRLLAEFGRTGAAWDVGMQASAAQPEQVDQRIVRAMLHVAAAAEELSLLNEWAPRVAKDDVSSQLELARAARRCGDGDQAHAIAQSVEARSEGDPRLRAQAFTLMAQAAADVAARRSSADALRDAIVSARAAITVDPSFEPGWRLLLGLNDALAAGSRASAGDKAQASALRGEALDAVPQSSLALQLAVERLFSGGRGADALERLYARAASDVTEPDLLNTVVRTLVAGDRRADALSILENRLLLTPADTSAWQLWMETTIADGRADDAYERLLERATGDGTDAGEDPIAVRLLQFALRALQRNDEADVLATRLLTEHPPSARRDLTQAAQSLATDDAPRAVAILDDVVQRIATLTLRDVFASLELAARLPESDDRRRLTIRFGDELLERTAAHGPDAAGADPALVLRAALLVSLETPGAESATRRRQLAERAASAAIRAPTGVTGREAQAWQAAAQMFAEEERFADGSEFVATLLRLDERLDITTATRLGVICFTLDAAATGRSEDAVALFGLLRSRGARPFAKELLPTEREADGLYQLAGLFGMVGDDAGATAILTLALEQDPDHGSTLNNLAWARLEQGDSGPEVEAMLEKAHAQRPDDAAVLDSLGWLRYKRGRFSEAITLLNAAIERGSTNPGIEPFDHLGDAMWRADDKVKAIEAWRDVRRIADREYSRSMMLRVLGQHQRSEYGVEVIDGPRWWQKNYGRVIDRAEKKLAQCAAGNAPDIAPIKGAIAPAASR